MAGNKPCLKYRIGSVKIAAWENQGEHGPWYSIKLARSYKDKNGNWQETATLGDRDLLAAAQLLEQMHRALKMEVETPDQTPSGTGDAPPPPQEKPPF